MKFLQTLLLASSLAGLALTNPQPMPQAVTYCNSNAKLRRADPTFWMASDIRAGDPCLPASFPMDAVNKARAQYAPTQNLAHAPHAEGFFSSFMHSVFGIVRNVIVNWVENEIIQLVPFGEMVELIAGLWTLVKDVTDPSGKRLVIQPPAGNGSLPRYYSPGASALITPRPYKPPVDNCGGSTHKMCP